MITIQRHGNGYLVKAKDHIGQWRKVADDWREVVLITAHYYGERHAKKSCPVCREIAKRNDDKY